MVLHNIQDPKAVSWCTAAKGLFFYGPYGCSGMLVSINVLFHFLPLLENVTSVVDTHVATCHPSMWAILVLTVGSPHLILLILDRGGGKTSLTTVVHRDGQSLFFFLITAPPTLDIGVIYYLYLFCKSYTRTEWDNCSWWSPVISCINLIVVKAFPVSWGPPLDLFPSF